MDIHDIHRFTIISYPFTEFGLVGPLQLSFAPLAQSSSYATDCWMHKARALEHKVRVLKMEQSCRLYCSSLV